MVLAIFDPGIFDPEIFDCGMPVGSGGSSGSGSGSGGAGASGASSSSSGGAYRNRKQFTVDRETYMLTVEYLEMKMKSE